MDTNQRNGKQKDEGNLIGRPIGLQEEASIERKKSILTMPTSGKGKRTSSNTSSHMWLRRGQRRHDIDLGAYLPEKPTIQRDHDQTYRGGPTCYSTAFYWLFSLFLPHGLGRFYGIVPSSSISGSRATGGSVGVGVTPQDSLWVLGSRLIYKYIYMTTIKAMLSDSYLLFTAGTQGPLCLNEITWTISGSLMLFLVAVVCDLK